MTRPANIWGQSPRATFEDLRGYHEMTLEVEPTKRREYRVALWWDDLRRRELGPVTVTVSHELDRMVHKWLHEIAEPLEPPMASVLGQPLGRALYATFLAKAVRRPDGSSTTFLREIFERWVQGAKQRLTLRLRLRLAGTATRFPWETLCVPRAAVPKARWLALLDELRNDLDLYRQLTAPGGWLVRWPWLSLVRDVDGAPSPTLLHEHPKRRVLTSCADVNARGAAHQALLVLRERDAARCFHFKTFVGSEVSKATMRDQFRARGPHVLVHLGHCELAEPGAEVPEARWDHLLLWRNAALPLRDLAATLAGTSPPSLKCLVLIACASAPGAADLARSIPVVVALNAPGDGCDLAPAVPTLIRTLMTPGTAVDEAVRAFLDEVQLADYRAKRANTPMPHAFLLPAVYLAPGIHALVPDPCRQAAIDLARQVVVQRQQLRAAPLLDDLPVEDFFMPRSVRVRPSAAARSAAVLGDDLDDDSAGLLERLAWSCSRVVVEGEGGSGKSELLQHLARRLGERAIRDLGSLHGKARLPLVATCATNGTLQLEATTDLAPDAWQQVEEQLATNQQQAVVLIDGITEWGTAARSALGELLTTRPWYSVVATCRVGQAEVAAERLGGGDVVIADLLPLQGGDVDTFLSRLESRADYGAAAQRVRDALRDNPRAMVLCQRAPLLLHALVRAAAGRTAPCLVTDQPATIAQLLGAAVVQILQEVEGAPLPGIRKGEPRVAATQRFLRKLAWYIDDGRFWNGLPLTAAEEVAGQDVEEAPQFLKALISTTRLLRRVDQESVRFCHDRIYEHFLVEYLLENQDDRRRWVREDWWRRRQQPVLTLLYARLDDSAARLEILKLMRSTARPGSLRHRLFCWAAARCCHEAGSQRLADVTEARDELAAALGRHPDLVRALLGLGTALPGSVRALLPAPSAKPPASGVLVQQLIEVARALGGHGDMDWREALRILLDDAGPECVPTLLEGILKQPCLSSKNPAPLVEAAAQFAWHPQIATALLGFLDHPSWQARQAAARAVGGVAQRPAVRSQLLAHVRAAGGPRWQRVAAAAALARPAAEGPQHDRNEVVATLEDALRSRRPDASWLAAAAAVALGPAARDRPDVVGTLLAAAGHAHPWVRQGARAALAHRVDDTVVQAELVEATKTETDAFALVAAIRALARTARADDIQSVLSPRLEHHRAAVRVAAARALGTAAAESRVTAGLVTLLRDPDEQVRDAAADALSAVVGTAPKLRRRLLGKLRSRHTQPHERRALVRALRVEASAEIRDLFLRQLEPPDEWTRITTIASLGGWLKDETVRERLIAALGDPASARVRGAAARVLRGSRERDVRKAFRERLKPPGETDADVRRLLFATLVAEAEEVLDATDLPQVARALVQPLVDAVTQGPPDASLAVMLAQHLGVVANGPGEVRELPGCPCDGQIGPVDEQGA